jgi:hypothetical protein
MFDLIGFWSAVTTQTAVLLFLAVGITTVLVDYLIKLVTEGEVDNSPVSNWFIWMETKKGWAGEEEATQAHWFGSRIATSPGVPVGVFLLSVLTWILYGLAQAAVAGNPDAEYVPLYEMVSCTSEAMAPFLGWCVVIAGAWLAVLYSLRWCYKLGKKIHLMQKQVQKLQQSKQGKQSNTEE